MTSDREWRMRRESKRTDECVLRFISPTLFLDIQLG